jgi:hypothetical protein
VLIGKLIENQEANVVACEFVLWTDVTEACDEEFHKNKFSKKRKNVDK